MMNCDRCHEPSDMLVFIPVKKQAVNPVSYIPQAAVVWQGKTVCHACRVAIYKEVARATEDAIAELHFQMFGRAENVKENHIPGCDSDDEGYFGCPHSSHRKGAK